MMFLLSLALTGIILGIIVAFASWYIGKIVVLSSIGLFAITMMLGDVFVLVDDFFEGKKKLQAKD